MEEDNIEDFKIDAYRFGKYKLIAFENAANINLYTAKEIEQIFSEGNKEGMEDWAIDLSKIAHIDSSGLGVLATQGVMLSKKSKRLFIINPNRRVKHLFSVSGFHKIFIVVSDKSLLPP